MKFSSCDNFCQFFHIGRFDVNNVETLILYVEVPEIDSQIVTADKSLPIAVDRYAVDVIGVSIGIRAARNCGNNSVVVCQAW
jgi:hypothetical protein